MRIEENKNLQEIPKYDDTIFPVSMHVINKYDMYPEGRGFQNPHWHDELQFTMATKGNLGIQVDGKEFVLREGEAIFINRNLIHVTTSLDEDGQYVGIMFPVKLLGFFPGSRMEQTYVLPYVNNHNLSAFHLKRDTDWQSKILNELVILRELFARRNDAKVEYEIALSLVQCWFVMIKNVEESLAKASQSDNRRHERTRQMMEFIYENYGNQIQISDIAASANIGEEECRRCFRQVAQQTPGQYLMRFRISKGMEMLNSTNLSITEIAYKCGFSDSSHFVQSFKKITDMTPKKFRDMNF